MADNRSIRDADNVEFDAATDELADLSHAPKVQLLDGTTAGTPISPATSGKQDTGNTSLSSIDTRAGSLTESAPASDTASSGLNGRLQRIAQRLTSLIALLPVALGAQTRAGSLAVALPTDQGTPLISRAVASLTRPADTPGAYTVGDAWGTAATTVFTFASAAPVSGGKGKIVGGFLTKNQGGVTLSDFKLHLFQNTPSSAPAADHAVINFLWHSDRLNYIGWMTFQTGVAGGGNGSLHEWLAQSRPELLFDTASGTDIFGIVELRGAYVPPASEVLTIILDIEQGR